MFRPTLAILALLAAGCGAEKKPDTPAPATKPTAAPEAAKPAASGEYPLKTCIVSGEELGGMGPPVVRTYDGTEVRFCCEKCVPEFEANKDKLLAQVRAAKK